MSQEVFVDIGGGSEGSFLLPQAKKNPNNLYISLDQEVQGRTSQAPQNLYLIKWRASENSGLPFAHSSVTSVSMNFLCGIGALEWPTPFWTPHLLSEESEDLRKQSKEVSLYFYEQIIEEVKRVLKPGGSLYISDVKMNFPIIMQALQSVSFTPPLRLCNITQSKFAEAFATAAVINPDFLPLETIAIK